MFYSDLNIKETANRNYRFWFYKFVIKFRSTCCDGSLKPQGGAVVQVPPQVKSHSDVLNLVDYDCLIDAVYGIHFLPVSSISNFSFYAIDNLIPQLNGEIKLISWSDPTNLIVLKCSRSHTNKNNFYFNIAHRVLPHLPPTITQWRGTNDFSFL